ncbi:MAG: hypothetical protein K8J09_19775 [Planctomycetes bacterium]|nr:hypothetical protein [Planctomycetota bacterium]MCC7395547.1 hypothetical protein [Planctomycetota bacterium]
MAKSPFVVLGIGVAGCLALALMLRQVVDLRGVRERSPYAALLEQRFAAELEGPVRVRIVKVAGRTCCRVFVAVGDGVDGKRLAEQLGTEVWLATMRGGEAPDDVAVELTSPRWGQPLVASVPRPRLGAPERALPPQPRGRPEVGASPAR